MGNIKDGTEVFVVLCDNGSHGSSGNIMSVWGSELEAELDCRALELSTVGCYFDYKVKRLIVGVPGEAE